MATKRKYKLDLFPLLRNISTKNVRAFDNLTEENLKEFNAFLLMRWLTGYKDKDGSNMARQICFLNGFVNPYVWHFDTKERRHKKLLYNLMTICASGNDYRYKFIKVKKKSSSMPKTAAMIMKVFDYSKKDADDVLVLFSDTDIINMAEQLGKQKNEISEIRKELRTKRPK